MSEAAAPHASGAYPAPGAKGLWPALLLLFVLAFLRCPFIFIHGRVWAEESTIFLGGAWNTSFHSELLAAQFGYFSIWDNFFAAVAAHWVRVTLVALLFSWSAILLLLVTGYFIFQAEFLESRAAKTAGVLTLLLTAPSNETWLNLINSEFYFGILAAVILLSDASRLRGQRNAALLLATLSGPLTTLLAPLVVLRLFFDRSRPRVIQALVVLTGALVQVGVALTTSTSNRKVHLELLPNGPVLFNKEVVLLFFDRVLSTRVFLLLRDRLHYSTASEIGTWVLFLAASTGIAFLVRSKPAALRLLAVGIWFAVIEAVLALNGGLGHVEPGGGERYAFTPNVLLELALVVAAFAAVKLWQRTAARTLLAFAMLSGAVDFLYFPLLVPGFWRVEPWRQQALRWEKDPSTPLHVVPAVWPVFHLPPQR